MRWKRRKSTTPKAPKAKAVKKPLVAHTVTPEEESADGTLLLKFTIPGRPATKKTHQQVIYVKGSPRVIPSAQYKKYEKHCKTYCQEAWQKDPMDFGVSIHVRVFLDTWTIGDHVGYLQAIGDILEEHGVVANDKFIHWSDDGEHWFGGVDKENPRLEVVIRRFRHPYEEYRDGKEAAEARKQERAALKAAKEA